MESITANHYTTQYKQGTSVCVL